MQDPPGHHEPLGHAAGEGHDRRLGAIGQAEPDQGLVGRRSGRLGAHAEETAVEVEVLPDGERPVERVGLGNDPDHLFGQRRVRDHVDAGHDRPAAGGYDAGGEHAGGRRLAGAVGTEQPEDLPVVHR